jgi:hypothetical protein
MIGTVRSAAAAIFLTGFALASVVAAQAADDISFKRRKDAEKEFVDRVGTAVVKAAHGTARKIALVDFKYTQPKANRTELTIKMEYSGVVSGKVTGKKYVADILIKIDSTDKNAWEVLNLEYNDNNNVPQNRRKLQELIKEMNK